MHEMTHTTKGLGQLAALLATVALLAVFAGADSAGAAPPGSNGRLVVWGGTLDNFGVGTIEPDGTDYDLVSEFFAWAENSGDIDVSADGKHVLVAIGDAAVDVNLETGVQEVVLGEADGWWPYSAVWSADRTDIAFIDYNGSGLYVKKGDADPVALGAEGLYIHKVFDWSPVDDRVLVSVVYDEDVRLMTIDTETEETVEVAIAETWDEWGFGDADFSPDGSRIVYTSIAPVGVFITDSAGSFHEPVDPDAFTADEWAGNLAWSPDGSKIAYIRWFSEPEFSTEVVIRSVSDDGRTSFTADNITFLEWAPSTEEPPPPPPEFEDVPGDHLFADEIGWLAAEGITKGCNPPVNDRFCPNAFVTRAQMASFLTRALDLATSPSSFIDVGPTNVHGDDIGALAAAGITKGCNPAQGNTRFCPDDFVTRAQMAAFLYRALAP